MSCVLQGLLGATVEAPLPTATHMQTRPCPSLRVPPASSNLSSGCLEPNAQHVREF